MSTRTNIRLFAVSPNDVSEKRDEDVAKVVAELNKSVARNRGYSIEVVTWKDVVPNMGRPQQVILDAVGDYDILVGIMKHRFGSPTGKYLSGTEEEFHKAYDSWMNSGRPRILFYFQRGPGPGELEYIDEYKHVLEFKKLVEQHGLVREYGEDKSFVDLFRTHLTRLILEWKDEPRDDFEEEKETRVHYKCWKVWRDALPECRQTGQRIEDYLIATAQQNVKFMTISGRSIYSGQIEEILKEKSKHRFCLQLLLFDWNSEWIKHKMQDERRQTDLEINFARKKAIDITKQFFDLLTVYSVDIKVKLYKEYPVWRMLVVDNETVYAGFYAKGKRGYEGPMFKFDRADEFGLFYPMNECFDSIWRDSGQELVSKDDPRFELLPLDQITSATSASGSA
jgi:hypothetical protein